MANGFYAGFGGFMRHLGQTKRHMTSMELNVETETSPSSKDLKNSLTFEVLYDSIIAYNQTYGNVKVPQDFDIPNTTKWPAQTRGFRLGAAIRSVKYYNKYNEEPYRGKLKALGIHGEASKLRFEILMKALNTYKNIYGDIIVPSSFRVPMDDPAWPEVCWGMTLGRKVLDIRAGRIHNSTRCKERLIELGFNWTPFRINSLDNVYLALESFKSFHGHLRIPRSYEIAKDSDYPPETWGLKLGNFVNNVRYRGDYVTVSEEVKRKLEDIGLYLDHIGFDTRHWNHIYTALLAYKKEYGHLYVPSSFTVPCNDPWPEEVWDLKLGYRCNNIRYRGDFLRENPEYRTLLNEIGFPWKNGRARTVTEITDEERKELKKIEKLFQ
eukprot:gene8717-18024_t